jgi:hypothetical protein
MPDPKELLAGDVLYFVSSTLIHAMAGWDAPTEEFARSGLHPVCHGWPRDDPDVSHRIGPIQETCRPSQVYDDHVFPGILSPS